MSLTHKLTGSTFFMATPCDRWTHLECARRRARENLAHIADIWKEYSTLYVTHTPRSEEQRKRTNQRASRTGARVIRIDRYWGEEYLYSTAPLPGQDAPHGWEPLSYPLALDHLHQVGMTIVGVERIAYPRGWTLNASRSGEFIRNAYLTGDDFEAIFERARAVAAYEFEVHVDKGQPLPDGITVKQWLGCYRLAEDMFGGGG